MTYSDLGRGTTLEPLGDVQDRLFARIHYCIACGKREVPRGVHRTYRLADWAAGEAERTGAGAADEARRVQFGMDKDERCIGCYAELSPVIGLPDKLLYSVLYRLRGERRTRVRGFLSSRFVFLFCRECRESPHEERVTVQQIRDRYQELRTEMRDADLPTRETAELAEEVFLLIEAAIQARDAA